MKKETLAKLNVKKKKVFSYTFSLSSSYPQAVNSHLEKHSSTLGGDGENQVDSVIH